MADTLPNPPSTSDEALARVAHATALKNALGDRNNVTDSAVNIVDTLQQLTTLALSPLPGVQLEDSLKQSRELDKFRSPAYLAARELSTLNDNPQAGFVEGAVEAGSDALFGGNLGPDLATQIPYLALGPVSRLAQVSRVAKMGGIAGKIAQLTLGDTEGAVANRIALLGGAAEGQGAYAQTYERALNQYGDEDIAHEQALKSAAFTTVLATVLGRATPGFELHPTGKIGSGTLSHLSAVAGEAFIEEGGQQAGQQIYDNILAGKDPMEGVGAAYGQAAAIAGPFAAGIRGPHAILDVSKDIGKSILKGAKVLGSRATTPEEAAIKQAAKEVKPDGVANEQFSDPTVQAEPVTQPTDQETRIRSELSTQGLEGVALEKAVSIAKEAEASIPEDKTTPTVVDDIASEIQTEESSSGRTTAFEAVDDGSNPSSSTTPIDANSSSSDIQAVLVNAQNEQEIENTTGATQANAIARQEELAPFVEEAAKRIDDIPDTRVAQYVDAAEKGDEEANRRVEAIKRVDITKLPDTAIEPEQQPLVTALRSLKDLKLNRTSNEILNDGFRGGPQSRGIRSYIQGLFNIAAIGVDKPNQTSKELIRFMTHLRERAEAFKTALATAESTGKSTDVEASKTLNEKDNLQKKPFVIWVKDGKVNPNTRATVEQVLADVATSEKLFAQATRVFPGMFTAEQKAPVKPVVKAEPVIKEAPKEEPVSKKKEKLDKAAKQPEPVAPESPQLPLKGSKENAEAASLENAAKNLEKETKARQDEVNEIASYGFLQGPLPENGKLVRPTDEQIEQAARQGKEPPKVHRISAPGNPVWANRPKTKLTVKQVLTALDKWIRQETLTKPEQRVVNYFREALAAQKASEQENQQPDVLEDEGPPPHTDEDAPPDINNNVEEPVQEKNKETITKAKLAELSALLQKGSFALFHGVNHFKNSFVETGKGILAKSFPTLLSDLRAGTAPEVRAADTLEKQVPKIVDSLNKYIAKVLSTKRNDMSLTEFIQSKAEVGNYNDFLWIHLLTESDKGFVLNPDIATAASIATLIQLVRASSFRNVEDGDGLTDDMYYQYMNNIAKDTMRIYGASPKTNVSETLAQGIPLSLAGTVLQALHEDGTLVISENKIFDETTEKQKTVKNIYLNEAEGVVKFLKKFAGFPDVLRKFLGDAQDDTIHYGEPPTTVAKTYRNSRTKTSKEQQTSVGNQQAVVYKQDTGFLNILKALDTKLYTKLITGFSDISKDPLLEKISISLVNGLKGELNAITRYSEGIAAKAEELGVAVEDVPVHFQFDILKNGRSFSSNSPQTKKTIRRFLSAATELLDLNNQEHVEKLKFTIAQSMANTLGIKTDIMTRAHVVSVLNEAIPGLTPLAEAMYQASLGNKVDNLEKLLDRDALYEPEELVGLMTLGKLLAHKEGPFLNTLSFEIDGKTNGPFMAELLFGLHRLTNKTRQNLAQGGFFHGLVDATLASMQDYFRTHWDGSKDLYDRVAKKTKLLNDPILVLAGFTSENGDVLRSTAKEAVTPLGYGSGVGSLSRVFERRINSGLVDKLRIAKRQNNAKLEKELRAIINSGKVALLGQEVAETLNAAFSEEKEQVRETNALMVAATTLHAGVRQNLFNAAYQKLRAEKIASGELLKSWELSRDDLNSILDTLPPTAVEVPGMGTIAVGENSFTGRSGTSVAGAGGKNSIQLSIPEIEDPQVSIIANLTIGAGDAAMANQMFQTKQQLNNVWDGQEMRVSEIDEMGVKLNQAILDSASDSLLDGFGPLLDYVLENIDKVWNENTSKTLLNLRKVYNTKSNTATVKALKADMERYSKNIKAGRAYLDSKPSSMNQMAGGLTGANTKGKGETRDSVPIEDYRTGWSNPIEKVFDAVGGKLSRSQVIDTLDVVKWKRPVQRYVWSIVRNLLSEGTTIHLAKTEAEWNSFDTGKVYGTVAATVFTNAGQIVMATTDPTVILHELIHSVFSNSISQYFSNINAVPVELRQPINDLVQLLGRFKKMKGGYSTSFVQGIVNELEAEGDTAAAVDEMLTYTISDQGLIDELAPSFITRVKDRVKQILARLFKLETTNPFFDDVMNAFDRLSVGPLVQSNDEQIIRDHAAIDPLLEKTNAAFAAIKRKIPQGNTATFPKTADSHLDKIQTAYNLSVDQQDLYNRIWTLMRMDNRSGELERFVSTVMATHPNSPLFNGAKDIVASVMAFAAVEPTFAAQADAIWKASQPTGNTVQSLVNAALNESANTDSRQLLINALDAIAASSEYNMSWLGTQTQRLNRIGNELLEQIGGKAEELSQTAPESLFYILKGISALTTEKGAHEAGKTLLKAVNEFTNQRWLQDLMATLIGSQSDTNVIYRQVNTLKSKIAQTRSMFTITLPAQMKKLFPKGFDGWNHLYNHLGRIDAGVLGENAGQMYTNGAERTRLITALKSKLSNREDAENLAYFLIHGSLPRGTTRSLLRNAQAIADDLNNAETTKRKKAPDSLVKDVDQLVTLLAIEEMAESDRARIGGYFTQHPEAMNTMVGMLQKVSEEDAKQYSHNSRYTYWKGNLPLSTDPRASIVLARPVKGAELIGLGYTKGARYKSGLDDPNQEMHYYTRNYAPPPAFSQGILATVQQTAQGINYTTAATISPEVGTMVTDPRLVSYITLQPRRGSNLVPVFNYNGDIVAYERLLDRKIAQEATKSNGTMLHIAIGQKLGRIVEERLAIKFNEQAIELLKTQWESGKAVGDENQYEDVSSSKDKQIARAWEVIPADTKKALEAAFEGPVMIRKDLVANTIGYHKAGINDIFTGNASLSPETRKTLYGLATSITGVGTIRYLYAAESAIKEGVATAKDWIIVRSISVAVNNAFASMNSVLSNGVPIRQLLKTYATGIKELRTYNRLNRESLALTVQIAGASEADAKRLRTLQVGKQEAIKRLEIYPLIETGELSDLPEGLEDTPQHSYAGDFSGWLNNHLRKIHPKTPILVANAIIAKDSAFHDALSKTIQAGDFLGKFAVYKHLINTGKTSEEALNIVRDEFVSYGTNPGRFRGALEDYGVIWWSQFTLRAQKVLLRRFRKNPFSFFVSTGFGDLTGTDSISDTALWERGWDNSTGLDNVLSAPSAHIFAKVF